MTLLGRRNILRFGLIFHFLTFNLNDRHFFQISKIPFFSQTVFFLLKFHIQRRPIRICCNSRKGINKVLHQISKCKGSRYSPTEVGLGRTSRTPSPDSAPPRLPAPPSQLPYNASQCAQPDRYGYSPPPPRLRSTAGSRGNMVYCVPAWAEVD